MQQKKYKTIAICLAVLCVVSAVAVEMTYFGICTAAAQAQGLHKVELIGKYAVYPIGVMVVYMLPLVYYVQRFFYKAEMEKMWRITRTLWIFECVCTGVLVAYLLVVYFTTGSFLM